MKKIILLLLILVPNVANAQLKITELTADAAPSTDDLVVTVNDPGGTPASRKSTIGNLLREPNLPSTITRDIEWDTIGEIETATSVNVIVSTEIDTVTEINTLTTDNDVATLAGSETLTNKTIAAADNVVTADDTICTDCLNATEIEDIYTLNSGDTITGAVTINDNGGTGSTLLTIGDVNDADSVVIFGDLTVTGDDITMGTNTSGHILVADGTNFNPVAVSGDMTIDSTGATTIGADKVALTTDTTGGYAASTTEGGGATSLEADGVDALTEIAQGIKSAADDTSKLIVGTAGSNGEIAKWNTDGTLTDSNLIVGTLTDESVCEYEATGTFLNCDTAKSGADATIVTGTAGLTDECAKWNADGDLVSAGAACGTSSGAPVDADYLVGTANGGLSAEIVVGTSPGGELGGTWASPTIDDTGITLTSITIGSLLGVDSIDATGAVDMDYGSVDITDHTFIADGGTVVIDGSITQDAGTTLFMGGLLDAVGAVDMDYGSVDITDHTFVTDGTGTAEIVLPAGSIDSTEILDDTVLEADFKAVDTASDEECLTYETTTGDFEWQACASGGGGGATEVILPIYSAKISGTFTIDQDATQGAQIDAGDGNWRLLFDATTDEGAVWQFRMPNNYSSTPVLKIQYTMASATANEVEFEGAIMCVTDADAADVGTASFSAIAVGSATVPGTAGYMDEISITLTDDSCAAGDAVWVYLSTDADDATNDDSTGDREIINVSLSYTGS